ncbi:MAG: lytic transglycosylase domain-containing protein, partial [Hyphomicrobiales bacterium]|nr:lytic transglycosylase domain-containing protein [Hyphomicrobiales bacterium]
FHAGWYALRFLKDPRRAEPHFKRIVEVSKGAKSLSRGHYWLGRTAKARGDRTAARRHFEDAARYATAYHGQLARAELGGGALRMASLPNPGATAKAKFRNDERIRAIAMLNDAGSLWLAVPIFRHLAVTMTEDEQIVLLAALAEGYGQHNLALQVGILASGENDRLEALAFPTSAIPSKARISGVEKPLVYAIARQESAFNPGAVSRAGARGLLQLMPGTAKRTARNIGLGYSKTKLTADPAYNATLGAAHLDELVDKFGGSYIMTFAGYNAGARRVDQWVARYGDPRSRKVDAIDWIERIPFTETRNYVQKILENLQVYRDRLEGKKLGIEKDLKRGG